MIPLLLPQRGRKEGRSVETILAEKQRKEPEPHSTRLSAVLPLLLRSGKREGRAGIKEGKGRRRREEKNHHYPQTLFLLAKEGEGQKRWKGAVLN